MLVSVYKDKSFDFVIKTPPAAVQLLEAAKVKKGSGEPNRKKVAKVTWDQVKAIAEDKMQDLNAFTVEFCDEDGSWVQQDLWVSLLKEEKLQLNFFEHGKINKKAKRSKS